MVFYPGQSLSRYETEWTLCDGKQLSKSSNQELFSLIKSSYSPDNAVNFTVPNFQGRSPLGAGSGQSLSSRNIGSIGGTAFNYMTSEEMPSHNHLLQASQSTGNTLFQHAFI